MDPHKFLKSFMDTVWCEGDLDAISDFFADDAQLDGLAHDLSFQPEDYVTFIGSILMMVSDPEIEIRHLCFDGEWISALCSGRTTSRMSGAEITVTGQTMLRLKDGKIVEAYNHYDMMGFFAQLGLLPEGSLEKMLAGAAA